MGDDEAMVLVGDRYDGLTRGNDPVKAAKWYLKAAEAGNIQAMQKVSHLYEIGKGLEQSDVKKNEWEQKAKSAKKHEAEVAAKQRKEDARVKTNEKLDLLEKSAEIGNAGAMKEIAEWYLRYGTKQGLSSTEKYSKVVEWYHKAAQAGNEYAMNQLGDIYEGGYGVPKDEEKAAMWHHKAWQKIHDDLKNRSPVQAASVVESGDTKKTDGLSEIKQKYKEAAGRIPENRRLTLKDIGFLGPTGKSSVAEYGLDTLPNPNKAPYPPRTAEYYVYGLEFYRLAAEQGEDVMEENFRKAIHWFTKAANEGYPEAMYCLGEIYGFGLGLSQDDKVNELEWFCKAAQAGHQNAIDWFYRFLFNEGSSHSSFQQYLKWMSHPMKSGRINSRVVELIAFLYHEGLPVGACYLETVDWLHHTIVRFKEDARKGNKKAMMKLALMYNKGIGVKADSRKAVSYLKTIAEMGNVDAIYLLGEAYSGYRMRSLIDEGAIDGRILRDQEKASKYYLSPTFSLKGVKGGL